MAYRGVYRGLYRTTSSHGAFEIGSDHHNLGVEKTLRKASSRNNRVRNLVAPYASNGTALSRGLGNHCLSTGNVGIVGCGSGIPSSGKTTAQRRKGCERYRGLHDGAVHVGEARPHGFGTAFFETQEWSGKAEGRAGRQPSRAPYDHLSGGEAFTTPIHRRIISMHRFGVLDRIPK